MTTTSLRVLLIEDDRDGVRAARTALCKAGPADFDWQHVQCLAAARRRLAGERFDVILLDLDLSDGSGPAALREIRRQHAEIPVVVLTDEADETVAARPFGGANACPTDGMIADGAGDCLPRDELTPGNLRRVLRYATRWQQLLLRLQSANDLLDQKNRRLAQLNETAFQFVDHVSHEFRTPLTVIKEFVSIIRDGLAGRVSEQQREFLEIVNDRADDLAIIVDDMLDVSKLKAGLLSVWRRKSKIRDVFGQVRAALQRKADIKKDTLDIVLQDNLPAVFCDPEKIARVIVNLAVNAIKFCGENGSVRLDARSGDDGSEIVVAVHDDGPGIEPQNLQLIFDRFHQAAPATDGSTKGFGLGLSIAKELVDLNFGSIDVESEPGKGSTFSFSIPVFNPGELALRCLRSIERCRDAPARAALIVARVLPSVQPAVANVVDEFLQHAFRGNGLVMQVELHKWLVLSECRREEADGAIDRVRTAWAEANRNRLDANLPEIDFFAKGTWPIDAHTGEILRQFHAELPAAEEVLEEPMPVEAGQP